MELHRPISPVRTIACLVLATAVAGSAVVEAADTTVAASLAARGGNPRLGGFPHSASADGRFVVLASDRPLTAGIDGSGASQLFLRDRAEDTTTLISHRFDDPATPADDGSGIARISADGAYVLFRSLAGDLIAGGVSSVVQQCYLFERASGAIVLVSQAAGAPGEGGDDDCRPRAISADGRFLALTSDATDLVAGQVDDNGLPDVFLYDRLSASMTLVSHVAGAPEVAAGARSELDAPTMSADGGLLAFSSESTELVSGYLPGAPIPSEVYVFDRPAGVNRLVSRSHDDPLRGGNGRSREPSISADGGFVAFLSRGTDLIAGFVADQLDEQVYRADLATGVHRLISHARAEPLREANGQTLAAAISADGAFIAFDSRATNLVPGYVDQNGEFNRDIYRWRADTGGVRLVSHAAGDLARGSNGLTAVPAISADGLGVAFESRGTNLVAGFVDQNGGFDEDIFHWRQATTDVVLVSHVEGDPLTGGNRESRSPAFVPDGSALLFTGDATDLVDDGVLAQAFTSSAFLVPLVAGSPVGQTLERVSAPGFGVRSTTANLESDLSRIDLMSADGARVVFTSRASDLVAGVSAPPGLDAVYLYDRDQAAVSLVSHAASGPSDFADGASSEPRISADGGFVLFQSAASDLVAGFVDNNGEAPDLFLYETATGIVSLVSRSTAGAAIGAAGSGEATNASRPYAISGDGAFVAFASTAGDLVAGFVDRNNNSPDLFLFERASGAVTLVSHAFTDPLGGGIFSGSGAPRLASDGSFVVFVSASRDLIDGTNLNDANVYLFERATGTVTLVSHRHDGATIGLSFGAGDAQISADGATLAFTSVDPEVVAGYVGGTRREVLVVDRDSGVATLVAHAFGLPTTGSSRPTETFVLSDDGSHVVFDSTSLDLIEGQTGAAFNSDVFLWDRATNTNRLLSRRFNHPMQTGNGDSRLAAIAPDASVVIFNSGAPDLIEGYLPHAGVAGDAYRYDTASGVLSLYTHRHGDPLAGLGIGVLAASDDGQYATSRSRAFHLVPRDHNEDWDVLLFGSDVDADLSLQIGDAPDPVAPGGTVTYTLEVTQAGPGAAAQVSVLATLPAATALLGASGAGWSCATEANDLICDLETALLPAAVAPPLELQAQMPPAVGSITVAARARSAMQDLAPANNLASATTTLTGVADLAVAMTVDPPSVVPGELLGYQIVAQNPSAETVSEAMVTDLFPPSLACAWTSVAAGGASGNSDAAGQLSDRLTMPPGSSVTYAVSCLVDPAATGMVSNIVTIGSAATDPDPSDNQVMLDTPLTPEADLGLDKSANVATVDPGNEMTYTLAVTNLGASTSTGGSVGDPLPADLSFVSSPDGCTEAAGTVTCAFGVIDPQATVELRFVVMVGAGAGPTIQNTATVTGNEPDPDGDNDSDSEETPVVTTAPTVESVRGAGASGESVLADCASSQRQVEELRVTFSEPMEDPPGDGAVEDVTNPANYRLVGTGLDLAFTTVDCSGPASVDDQVIAVDGVTFDDVSQVATLAINGSSALRPGVYRLLVCGTLEDLLGNPLDGDADGIGGDDFRSGFRLARRNAFANGHFDCTLDDWLAVSTNPLEIAHSTEDIDAAAVSGSAHLRNLTASTAFALAQCVPVSAAGGYALAGFVRLDAAPPIALDVSLTCEAFDAPACGGASLAIASETSMVVDTGGGFRYLSSTGSLPATTASTLCGVDLATPAGDSFDAFLDRLELHTGVIFGDGFESGDTSAWSQIVP